MIPSLKRVLLLLILAYTLLTANAALGQQLKAKKPSRVPIYRSSNDSIQLAHIDQLIEQAYLKILTPQFVRDSLTEMRTNLSQEAIVAYRNVYYSNEEMTSYDNLKTISRPDSVVAITIEGKKLKRIPSEVLKCHNVQTIELVNCRIPRLQRSIRKLRHLTTVVVLNNSSKRPLRFPGNNTITTVIIHGEYHASTPVRFKSLKNLKSLNLGDCKLTSFPNGIYHNKKLEELDLQHNTITLQHDQLKPLPSLHRLALQYNNIRSLPPSISIFKNLQRLNLNHNKLVEVAPEISSLKKIEYISFYNNELTSVPRGLFALTCLKMIDLYFNKISELPDDVGAWKDLEVLNVAHNQIWTLPDTLLSLTNLSEIYAYDNRLVRLPINIDRLSNLRVLRVNENLLKEIPLSLMNLRHIEDIDFSGNYITHLPPGILDFPDLKIATFLNNPLDDASVRLLREKYPVFKAKEIHLQFTDVAR